VATENTVSLNAMLIPKVNFWKSTCALAPGASGVYHFSPLCNLTRQHAHGIADTTRKKDTLRGTAGLGQGGSNLYAKPCSPFTQTATQSLRQRENYSADYSTHPEFS
jgi:hypothetical protein